MKCIKGKEIQVLKSAAGYYIGCFDEGPYCRISGYYKTEDTAQTALDRKAFFRDAPENAFCNGGCGCLVDDFDEEEEVEIENDCRTCSYELDHEYEDETYFDGMAVIPVPRPIVIKPVFGKEYVYTSSPWPLDRNTRKGPSTFIMQDVFEKIKEWAKEDIERT